MNKKQMQFFVFISVIILLSFFSFIIINKNKKIKIGFVGSLSGRNSQLGVNGRNALLMALEEINLRGGIRGRKLELVIKDNVGEPDNMQSIIKEFIDEEVSLVIGPYTSNMAEKTLKSIAGENLLIVSPTVSTDSVSGIDDGFIRLIESAAYQGEILANMIVDDKKTKLAVVFDHRNFEYTKVVYDRLHRVYQARGLDFSYTSEMPSVNGRVDFTTIAKEIVAAEADSLVVITNSIDAASLMQQVRKLDSGIAAYGSRWAKSGHIIEDGGRAVEGMKLVSNFSEKRRSGKFNDFMAAYKKRFGKEANFPQIYTYDCMYLLKQAIEEARSFKAADIKKAILYISRFQGLDAVVEIDKYGDAWRPHAMVKIVDGKFKDIK